jgi:hypothetical protein
VFGSGRGKTQFYSVAVTGDGRWLTIRVTEDTASAIDIYLADLSTSSPGQPELRPVQRGETGRAWLQIAPGTGPDGVIWLRTSQDAVWPCHGGLRGGYSRLAAGAVQHGLAHALPQASSRKGGLCEAFADILNT